MPSLILLEFRGFVIVSTILKTQLFSGISVYVIVNQISEQLLFSTIFSAKT